MSKVKLPTPLPLQQFARCVNDTQRPADYIGDWPEVGRVYAVRVLPHIRTGQPQVHVLGFYIERPYGAFSPPLRASGGCVAELRPVGRQPDGFTPYGPVSFTASGADLYPGGSADF